MRRRFLFSILISDLIALGAAMAVASAVVFDTPWFWSADVPFGESLWPMVGFLGGGALAASYVSARVWARSVPRPAYGRALAIIGAALTITSVGLVFARDAYYSRSFLTITAGVWLLGSLAHRLVRRRRPWTERMVVITAEKGLSEDLHDAPHVEVLTVLDPAGMPPSEPIHDGVLAVDLRSVLSDPMAQFVSSCNLAGIPVRSMNNVYEEHTGRLPMVHLVEGWEVAAPVSRRVDYLMLKRLADALLVLLTAPIWGSLGGLIWMAVKMDSEGPAIYKQRRVGRGGGEFTLYKFRTMVRDAEQHGPQFTAEVDERLTRVGRLLRRLRADEIPQLWNVLKGDLSLVGPRPERPVFVQRFSASIPFYAHRHLVRPGVTGWAQVNYGYADDEADTVEKLTYDLYYLKHMSPWLDINILGRSIWTVLSGFGAQ